MIFDDPQACADAAFKAAQVPGRRRVLVSGSLSPDNARLIAERLDGMDLGNPDPDPLGFENLVSLVAPDMACVIVQNPSFFGNLRDLTALQSECREWDVPLLVIAPPPCIPPDIDPHKAAARLARIPGIRVITDAFIDRFSLYLGEHVDSADILDCLTARGIMGCGSASLAYPSYPELRPVLIVPADVDAGAFERALRESLALVPKPEVN